MADGPIYAGLDIGTTKITAVVAEPDPSGEGIRILGVGTAPSDGLKRGVVVNLERTLNDIDHTLLQRIANDPAADGFNSPPAYTTCATTSNCVNYPTQPLGTYIYSTDSNELRSAFLRLSSQILRLSK